METSKKLITEVLTKPWFEMNADQLVEYFKTCSTAIGILKRSVASKMKQIKENPSVLMIESLETLNKELDSVNENQQGAYDMYLELCKEEGITGEELTRIQNQAKEFADLIENLLKQSNKAVRLASDTLDPMVARVQRRQSRQSSPVRGSGEHSGDPPNKISVATDLKPESIKLDADQSEFTEWVERTRIYFEASKLDKQSATVQLAYLRNVVDTYFWKAAEELADYEGFEIKDCTLNTGLELLKRTYLRKHNVFLLRLECISAKFTGATATQALTWFHNFRKQELQTGIFNLSRRELQNYWLLKELPKDLKSEIFKQTTEPELDETLAVLNKLATVENLTQTNKKKQPVNSVVEANETNKQVACFRCGGNHYRNQCNTETVWCESCLSPSHATEVCKSKQTNKQTVSRDSSRESRSESRASTKERESSSASSSSSEERKEKEKRRRRKERQKEKRENKKKEERKNEERKSRRDKPLRRNSSSTQAGSSKSRQSSSKSKSRSRSNSRNSGKNAQRGRGKDKSEKKRKERAGKTPKRVAQNAVHKKSEIGMNATREILLTFKKKSFRHKMGNSQSVEMAEQSGVEVAEQSAVGVCLDTGSQHDLISTSLCEAKEWPLTRLSEYQQPLLCGPNGADIKVDGKVELWVRLPNQIHSKRLVFMAVENLQSQAIIGLPSLKRLGWISKRFPLDIGESSASGRESESDDDDQIPSLVNAVSSKIHNSDYKQLSENLDNSEKRKKNDLQSAKAREEKNLQSFHLASHPNDHKEKEKVKENEKEKEKEKKEKGKKEEKCYKEEKTEKEKDEEKCYLDLLLEHSDYTMIPNLGQLPQWLQQVVTDYKMLFTNKLTKDTRMQVKPASFKIKEGFIFPDKPISIRLPPIHLRKACDDLIQELLEAGVIKPAPPKSPVTSRGIFVTKKGGKDVRLVVDYLASGANSALRRCPYPFFSPDQLTTTIPKGMNYFCTLDLKSAYYCHPLINDNPDDEDGVKLPPDEIGQSWSTFVTHKGRFQLTTLPQGASCSQDWLNSVLGSITSHPDLRIDHPGAGDEKKKTNEEQNEGDETKDEGEVKTSMGGVERIVDDVLIVAPTKERFEQILRTLLAKFEEHGVYINPTKLEYSEKSVLFGGLLISKEGVSQDPQRLIAISKFPTPRSGKDTRAFLGLINTLSRFTCTMLRSTKHLRALTAKNAHFLWTPECEKEFSYLKREMSEPRILSHFSPHLQTGMDVDCSNDGIGISLYQWDPKVSDEPQPGNFYLIRMDSIAAHDSWQFFSSLDKEANACLHACRKMRYYILGKPHVIIRNDHRPLSQTWEKMDIEQAAPRLKKVLLELREFDIDIKWSPASQMAISDCLSRYPVLPTSSLGKDTLDDKYQEMIKYHTSQPKGAINMVVEQEDLDWHVEDPMYKEIFEAASQDEIYQAAVDQAKSDNKNINWKDLPKGSLARAVRDDWCRTNVVTNKKGQSVLAINNTRFIVPKSYIPKVLEISDISHTGYQKAHGLCKEKYWWPGWSKDIEDHCHRCQHCKSFAPNFPKETEIIRQNTPTKPFQSVSMDEFSFEGEHFLMMCCNFSQFARYRKFPNKRTSSKIIEFLKEWGYDYGFMEELWSDAPPVFVSEEMEDWLKDNKIRHRTSSVANAASNGSVEACIRKWKYLKLKLRNEGRNSAGDMQEAWALLQDMPTGVRELAPARLAMLRERRNPMLPVIPSLPGEELEQGENFQKIKEQRKHDRNTKVSKYNRIPLDLEVGKRVLVQNKKGAFIIPAKVIEIRPNTAGRSAIIEYGDGSNACKNRKHMIEDTSQTQPDHQVSNFVSHHNFYLKVGESCTSICSSQCTAQEKSNQVFSHMLDPDRPKSNLKSRGRCKNVTNVTKAVRFMNIPQEESAKSAPEPEKHEQ